MGLVRFVTPESGKAQGSKLLDAETGQLLHGVRRVVVTAEVGNIVTIEAEFLCAQTEVAGRLIPLFTNPNTGKVQEVVSVKFADGSEWNV